MPKEPNDLHQRIRREILDNLDEELELELEETVGPGAGNAQSKASDQAFRQTYFRELFRLQSELMNLQDWVVKTGEKSSLFSNAETPQAKAESSNAFPNG